MYSPVVMDVGSLIALSMIMGFIGFAVGYISAR